jgi:Helix-turn-helix domain
MADNQKRYLSTREASAYTGIPANTLRKFRSEGRGPVYTKPAGRALYLVKDLDAFMESGRRIPAGYQSKTRTY